MLAYINELALYPKPYIPKTRTAAISNTIISHASTGRPTVSAMTDLGSSVSFGRNL